MAPKFLKFICMSSKRYVCEFVRDFVKFIRFQTILLDENNPQSDKTMIEISKFKH